MPGGRPLVYNTVEELQEAIDGYFISIADKEPATVQGLAIALGFSSRQSLINYNGREEFLDTITRAKLRIEHNKVVGAMTGKYNAQVTMFDLKNNHDHKEKTETEHSGGLGLTWLETKTYEAPPQADKSDRLFGGSGND